MGQSRTVCRLFHHIVTTVTLESIVSTISYSRSCNNYFGSHFLTKALDRFIASDFSFDIIVALLTGAGVAQSV
jgi:hypothetical protein